MEITAATIIAEMNRLAPPELAIADDPIGLAAGAPTMRVKEIILALDAGIEIINSAPPRSLIITHHPRFYRPLKNLAADDSLTNEIAQTVIKKNLLLLAAHTNFDIAPDGVNDSLALHCGLTAAAKKNIIEITHRLPVYKLTVFVPATHREKVIQAITAAGAGKIGEYRDCCYYVEGCGQFRPQATARPFIGKKNQLTRVNEYRVEAIVNFFACAQVEKSLRQTHPYEEPAFDFITLNQTENYGLGRYGKLTTPLIFADFLRRLRENFTAGIVYHGDLKRKIKTAAVWSGAGAAVEKIPPVDVLVTGELSYHAAEILRHKKVALVEIGHYASEFHILKILRKKLMAQFPLLKIRLANMGDERKILAL